MSPSTPPSWSSSATGTSSGGAEANRSWPSRRTVSFATARRWSLRSGLGGDGLGPGDLLLGGCGPPSLHRRRVQTAVPDAEMGHAGELAHGRPVGAHRRRNDLGSLELVVDASMAGRDRQAGGEALDIPFPGAGQRLVEVVDVEDHAPLGGGIDPEVGGVGVAAGLDHQPGRRRAGQVGRPSRPRPPDRRRTVTTASVHSESAPAPGPGWTACASRMAMGSARSEGPIQSPWAARGTAARAARPERGPGRRIPE